MSFKIRCPKCKAELEFTSAESGQRTNCPECQVVFRVPHRPAAKKPLQRAGAVGNSQAAASAEPPQRSAANEPDAAAAASSPFIVTDTDPAQSVSTRARAKKSSQVPPWMYFAGGGVALVLLVGVVVGIVLMSGSSADDARASGDEDDKPVVVADIPAEKSSAKTTPAKASKSTAKSQAPKTKKKEEPNPFFDPATAPPPDEPLPSQPLPGFDGIPVPGVIPEAKEPAPKKKPSGGIDFDESGTGIDFDSSGTPAPAKPPAGKGPDVAKPTPDVKTPAPKPPAPEQPGPEQPGPKRPAPKKPAPKPAVPDIDGIGAAVDPNCPTCRGTGTVPLKPFVPYVHVEGHPAPGAQAAVPWQWCPRCQKHHPKNQLVDRETARLKTAGQEHLSWEKRTGMNFIRAETHHVTLHMQLPPQLLAEAPKVALLLEQCANHLQQATKSTFLTPTRPNDRHLVMVWNKQGYSHLVQVCSQMPEMQGQNWPLIAKVSGFSGPNFNVSNMNEGAPRPEHMAVSHFAGAQIRAASQGKAPTWLSVGFPYYCEHAVTGKNLVSSIRYELKDNRFGPNWNIDLQRYASQGKLRKWDVLFIRDLADYQPVDHLSAYSIVSFLFQGDPAKFVTLVQAFRDGAESQEAIEKVYGKKLEAMQAAWVQWAIRQR